MAINDKLNGSEQPMNESLLGAPNGVPANIPDLADPNVPRSRWILLAARYRRLLACGGLGAMLLAFFLTGFVMHKKYKAQAMIRPSSPDQSGLGGLLQSTGLMQNSSSLGNGANGPPDPNELQAILQSYSFATSMIEQEHLAPKLLKGGRNLSSLLPFLKPQPQTQPPSPYSLYLMLNGRFNCDFSMRTGNMSLSFIDKNPELARTILGLYIDRLRDQVRAQAVRDNKAALRSLEQEASKATDPLLRDQLYQLAAFQMQQVTTAEANADFAFTVLDPPWVPPIPSAPRVLMDTVAAGVLAVLMLFFGLALRDLVPQFRKHLIELESEARQSRRDVPLRRGERSIPTPETDRPYTL